MILNGLECERFSDAVEKALYPSVMSRVIRVAFEKNYDELSQGSPVYRDAVFNIIRWANDNGKLIELLIGIFRENPTNPELQTVVDQHWQRLVIEEVSSNDILSLGLVESLVLNLKACQHVTLILPCCQQTWTEFGNDRPKIVEILDSSSVHASIKWLTTLGFWLKIYPHRPDGELYILDFVENLCRALEVENRALCGLPEWLKNARQELGASIPAITTNLTPTQKKAISSVRGYCVIDVEPLVTQAGKVNFQCQLHIEVGQDNQFDENERISLLDSGSVETPALAPLSPSAVAWQNPQLTPMRSRLSGWIQKAEEKLGQKCRSLRTKYNLKTAPIFDLTVEFCLPWEFLLEGVDGWEICITRSRRIQQNPVGRRYKVVVRSRDRITDPALINQLRKVWATTAPRQPADITDDSTKVFDNFDDIQQDEIVLAKDLSKYLGLALTCPLGLPEHEKAREKLLNTILEAGVPVVIWSRNHTLANLVNELRNFLTPACFCDLNVLMHKTYQARKDKTPLGIQLALWCDDPPRIETLHELFAVQGRLEA